MKKKAIITVGIPAFNEEANIQNLLRSLLSQKGSNFIIGEIIVVSDASTDKTVSCIKALKDSRIRLVENKMRIGQNHVQNLLLRLINGRTDYFLLLEADTLPKSEDFVSQLVSAIPDDSKFSMVVGNSVTTEPQYYFERIMGLGYKLRKEIYEKAVNGFNLYLCTSVRLFSREFLEGFRWSPEFHEDSYCFREALKSGLPIIRAAKAEIYFKPVENLHDYLLQSGKFQKAMQNEAEYSNIYHPGIKKIQAAKVLLRYAINKPVLTLLYFLVMVLARINSLVLPKYTLYWQIYQSSKKLKTQI